VFHSFDRLQKLKCQDKQIFWCVPEYQFMNGNRLEGKEVSIAFLFLIQLAGRMTGLLAFNSNVSGQR
jgi:hypothetical protein